MDRLGLESLQVPVTLYKSDESPSLSPNDWWPSHCSQLEVVAIGGNAPFDLGITSSRYPERALS
jgi:hypothetical protein